MWLVRADGSCESRQLTNDLYKDRGPSWSADGKEIYFYSDRSGRYEMWSIRPDGSGLRQLTATQGRPWWFPVGSPDGDHLVVSNELGTAIARLDPTKPVSEFDQLPALPEGGVFSGVAWSSDGSQLVGEVAPNPSSPSDALAVYNMASRSYKVFSTKPLGFRTEHWLPDGRRVLYQDEKGLAVLDVESGEIERAPALPNHTGLVDMAHDGKTLYLLHRSPEADIWMADLK
jgi:Tol biopolymer transport system component